MFKTIEINGKCPNCGNSKIFKFPNSLPRKEARRVCPKCGHRFSLLKEVNSKFHERINVTCPYCGEEDTHILRTFIRKHNYIRHDCKNCGKRYRHTIEPKREDFSCVYCGEIFEENGIYPHESNCPLVPNKLQKKIMNILRENQKINFSTIMKELRKRNVNLHQSTIYRSINNPKPSKKLAHPGLLQMDLLDCYRHPSDLRVILYSISTLPTKDDRKILKLIKQVDSKSILTFEEIQDAFNIEYSDWIQDKYLEYILKRLIEFGYVRTENDGYGRISRK